MDTRGLLDAITGDLRAQLTGLRTCEVHDGRWDADEIKRWSKRTPAMLVAWMGTAQVEMPGIRWSDCDQELAAFIMTSTGLRAGAPAAGRGGAILKRGEASRALVDWLLLYIPRARWGFTGDVGAATEIRARNLYSGTVDKRNLAVWTVTWRQKLRLEAPDSGVVLPPARELYSSAQDDPHEKIWPEAD